MMKQIGLFVLVVFGAAGQIPPHTQQRPNNATAIVLNGALTLEPPDLRDGIAKWLNERFDWTFSSDIRTNSNYPDRTWLTTYRDLTFIYPYEMWKVQAAADANGFNMESMLLHSSIDMKMNSGYTWSNMQRFDAFEPSLSNGVFTYNGTAYADVTNQSWTGSAATTIANTLYVGYGEPFDRMNFTMKTPRAGGSVTYEYWNGSTWTALSLRSDGTSGLTVTGRVYFYPPPDWVQTGVNGSKSKFWIRIVVSGASTRPTYTKVAGDDWSAASAGNNLRGWSPTDPNRINRGTRLEYNPNPPANATARFRYQARVSHGSNATFGNPSDVQNGMRSWGKFLTDAVEKAVGQPGIGGIFYDDFGAAPGQIASPGDYRNYLDFNRASTWTAEQTVMYAAMVSRLHQEHGATVPGVSGLQVGSNGYLGTGDFALCEGWWCNLLTVSTGSAAYAYGSNGVNPSYDSALPENNPQNGKIIMTCTDYQKDWAANEGLSGITRWHYVDRANRTPISCLAMHYIGWNKNTGFSYNSLGYFYTTTDEVDVYAPPTTLMNSVQADTSSASKAITLTDASGCSSTVEWAGGKYAVRLGTPESGDTVTGTLAGNRLTTTDRIYTTHVAGSPAYCIQLKHLSTMHDPPVADVYKWVNWFPAMKVDLGVPDSNGYRGGKRAIAEANNTPWMKGGAPDYISGLGAATCDANPGKCSDLWRRDFTNGIVLLRPWLAGKPEAELDTPSQPIQLGGTYYPLKADGTTGPGVTSVKLRGNEAAILMKEPNPLASYPPPVCNAGPAQTFRAGYGGQLDGSRSYAQGGSGLKYFWQQLSGPTRVRWSNREEESPRIVGRLISGTYTFQLTVTDSNNQSTFCTVKHGAVATDDNGVVITNNPAVDALLGPVVRFGANPWPWFDDRNKADADLQIAAMDADYPAWWDAAAPGTVAVAAGDKVVVGNGTAFTTTFCQGPANPAAPKSNAVIAIWYNTGTSGETGRRMNRVTGCTDDTHLAIDSPWDPATPAGSGLSYAADDDSTHYAANWGWGDADAPGNEDDNVAAYYSLYYRSGMEDYLAAARKLADRFWRSPMVDRGAAAAGPYGYTARGLSALGLVLRALELQGTPSDMWPGLHRIWDVYTAALGGVDRDRGPGMWDTEEEADHLAMVSYCALFDTDTAYRSKCKAAIAESLTNVWTPYMSPDGSWRQLYYDASSWDTGTSVTLANGSTDVTGNGTSWSAGNFPGTIWFTNNPATKAGDNSAGDAAVYTAAFVDATHLTLSEPYRGTSGVHGWAQARGTTMIGWGVRPGTMGLLAAAFDLAAKAIADTDPQGSTLARGYNLAAVDWIRYNGYWSLRKGLYEGVGGINCAPPVADGNAACTGGGPAGQSRALSAGALRGIMAAYAYNEDSGLRDFGDTLYNAMFAKQDTCSGSPACAPDGEYVRGLDDGGYMMTEAPPDGNRWFGGLFGFNSLADWPGYRVGGLQNANPRTGYVSFTMTGVRSAAKVRVTVTAPSGQVMETECAFSPCTVTLDGRQGKHLIQLQYLSGTGTVLSRTELPL